MIMMKRVFMTGLGRYPMKKAKSFATYWWCLEAKWKKGEELRVLQWGLFNMDGTRWLVPLKF